MVNNKKTSNAGGIVAGLVGLTAAAVGAYYLYGHKDAKKNRAHVKGWMLKAKGEVLEELEKAQDITEAGYHSAIDMVVKKYNELKSIDPKEIDEFMKEMKSHWSGIKKSVSKKISPKKKSTKK
jgi:hypothetical protein